MPEGLHVLRTPPAQAGHWGRMERSPPPRADPMARLLPALPTPCPRCPPFLPAGTRERSFPEWCLSKIGGELFLGLISPS